MTKGKNLKPKSETKSVMGGDQTPQPAMRQSLFETENLKVTAKNHPLISHLHDVNYNSPEKMLDRMH